jgi:hypothetical protein
MSAVPGLAGVTAVFVGLLWGCGFLVARLLVPRRWWPLLPLLAPFLGFALISAIAHVLGAAGHSLVEARWAFLVLPAVGWALVLLDPRLRRLPRSSLPALGMCLLAFLVAISPLVILGYLTTVGETIDGISYATRAEYLQEAPPELPDIPAGQPWLGWVRAQIQLLRVGDVYLVGLLGLLTGRPSYELLTLVSALFFALTAGSVFVWTRGSLGFRRNAALLAAGLVGTSNLLLWPVYDNFLSQSLAISLFPLLLCFGVEGQRRPEWRMAALFGVLLATTASVYPVYAVYALLCVLCFWAAAWFLRRRSDPRRAALWWLAAGAAAGAWNGVALARAWTELGFVSGLLSPGGMQVIGRGNILIFPPAVEILGLIAHAASVHGSGWQRVPLPVLTALGLGFAGLGVYGWWKLGRHARLAVAALLLTSALLAAQQRWAIDPPHGYPYGWFKAISALAPQVLALVAAGIAATWRHRSWRWVAAGAALLLVAVNLKHTLWTVSYTAESQVVLDRELIETARAAARLQPGAWALVDLVPGLQQHWLGVLLHDRKIHYRERLFTQHVETPGEAKATFQYALVEKSLDGRRRATLDEPWYSRASYVRVWGNGRYELRQRRDAVLASLAWGRPWPVGTMGEIAVAPERRALILGVGPEREESEMAPGRPRTVQMYVYSVDAGNRLTLPGKASPASLPPGGWILDFDLGCVPGGRIGIDHAAGAAVLAEVRVLAAATGRPGVCLEQAPLRTGAVYVTQEVLDGGKIRLDAMLVRPEGARERLYRLGLHVIDPAQQKLFGVWNLDFPPGERVQRGRLELDLLDRSSHGEVDGRPVELTTGSFDRAEGSFEGDVVLWQLSPTEQILIEPMLWFQRSAAGPVEVTRAVPASRLKVLPAP